MILAVLIVSGINVVGIDTDNDIELRDKVIFSSRTITTNGEYLSINVDEANTFLMNPGKPILPVYTKTYKFPLGTKIKNINCEITSDIKQEKIFDKIQPAPKPMPRISNEINEKIIDVEDKTVYDSTAYFPDRWYDYDVGVGLDGDNHVIFLTIKCYPIRYSPKENTIYSVNSNDIKVTYEESDQEFISADECDLVIIAPRKFSNKLNSLVKHKNQHNVDTILKTTESIYKEYEGRDEQEKIKYFIKEAVEDWGVKYVLLVGGLNKQRFWSWHLPARYSNLDDQYGWETGYISDLYYADLYKYNMSSMEYEFEDWDSNGNGVFAEWTSSNKDVLDLRPDVKIGRLACRNKFEVATVVKKIIRYETCTFFHSLYNISTSS